MSWLDYKYDGHTVRHRFRELLGLNSGPIEWGIRLAIIAFALCTMSNPAASIYIPPWGWAAIVLYLCFG